MQIDSSSPAGLSNAIDVRVAKVAQNVQRQQGEAAVELIETAGQNTPRTDGPVGRNVNVVA